MVSLDFTNQIAQIRPIVFLFDVNFVTLDLFVHNGSQMLG